MIQHILLASVFIFLGLNGYSYDIKVLRKWIPEYDIEQYWIGIADYHDKFDNANRLQRNKIEELLSKHNKVDILVLAEDLTCYNEFYSSLYDNYLISSRTGILAGLVPFCRQYRIPVINVEYRYGRVLALGPILNNIRNNPFSFSSAKRITVGHILREIEEVQMHLLKNSNLFFKRFVWQKMQEISQQMKALELQKYRSSTFAHYLQKNIFLLDRLQAVKNLLTFDGILIGLTIAHETLTADNKKKIIVFGGGTHINEAYQILQKIGGYEPVCSSVFSFGLVQESIATGNNNLMIKPKPISLELLEHYLKS